LCGNPFVAGDTQVIKIHVLLTISLDSGCWRGTSCSCCWEEKEP